MPALKIDDFLDSVTYGLITLDENGFLLPEYSKVPFSLNQFMDATKPMKEILKENLFFPLEANRREDFDNLFDIKRITEIEFEALKNQFPRKLALRKIKGSEPLKVIFDFRAQFLEGRVKFLFLNFRKDDGGVDLGAENAEIKTLLELKSCPPSVLSLLISDGTRQLRQLERDIEAQQWTEARKTIHSFKSICRSGGFSTLMSLIQAFEGMILEPLTNAKKIETDIQTISYRWEELKRLSKLYSDDKDDEKRRERDSELKDQARKLFTQIKMRAVAEATFAQSTEMREFEKCLDELTLESFSSISNSFRFDIKEISTITGRGARLVVKVDTNISFPRKVLLDLKTLATHLISNAIAHGIEDPEVRMESGRNPEGTIRLQLFKTSNFLTLLVEDDGQGLNKKKVLEKMKQQGRAKPDLKEEDVSYDELIEMIVKSNISTAETVSEVSGRGVGLATAFDLSEKYQGVLRYRPSALGGACFQAIFKIDSLMRN